MCGDLRGSAPLVCWYLHFIICLEFAVLLEFQPRKVPRVQINGLSLACSPLLHLATCWRMASSSACQLTLLRLVRLRLLAVWLALVCLPPLHLATRWSMASSSASQHLQRAHTADPAQRPLPLGLSRCWDYIDLCVYGYLRRGWQFILWLLEAVAHVRGPSCIRSLSWLVFTLHRLLGVCLLA